MTMQGRHFLKTKISALLSYLRSDYQKATMLTSSMSMCANALFAIFNGIVGFLHFSIFHIAIFCYYIILVSLKCYIILFMRNKSAHKSVYLKTHIFLVLMNICMVIPTVIMLNSEREYNYGLIPAIAVAAYTTLRVVLAAFHLRKSRKIANLLVLELRTINFVDALVAISSLQNTLIIASDGMNDSMRSFCAWSNGFIFLMMLAVSVSSFWHIRKGMPFSNQNEN